MLPALGAGTVNAKDANFGRCHSLVSMYKRMRVVALTKLLTLLVHAIEGVRSIVRAVR